MKLFIVGLNGPDNICENIVMVGQFGNVSTHFLKHSLHTQNTQYVLLFVLRANGKSDIIQRLQGNINCVHCIAPPLVQWLLNCCCIAIFLQ